MHIIIGFLNSASHYLRIILRVLTLFLLSMPVFAQYQFEISKFKEGLTCPEMVGTWYVDVTANSHVYGKVRHLTRLERKRDGSAMLYGVNIYLEKDEENSTWGFPSKWSCDGEWYVEKNEWGYVGFKILSLGEENTLIDELDNLGGGRVLFKEKKTLDISSDLLHYFENN